MLIINAPAVEITVSRVWFKDGMSTPNGGAIYNIGTTVTSSGYNVVDVALGTGSAQSGWAVR